MERSFVVVCVLSIMAVACGRGPSEEPGKLPVEERVARITTSLTPTVIIEGEAPAPATIEDRMRVYAVPGVSIAVIDGGEVAWARGFGFADLESQRSVTPDTLFQAASISKPVAALAALALVDRGELELDAPVNDRLTSWKVPDNEFTAAAPVTLRGLLTHTAGLTVHGFPGYGPDVELPDTVGVLDGKGNTDPVRVEITPRTEWRYSGGGFTVMQLLLEDVTGRPFAEVMAKTVLQPMGMVYSTYVQPLPEVLRGRAATGYRATGEPVEGRFHTYPEMAAAGLWTTPSDLARYLIADQRGWETGKHPVLSAKVVREMLTPGMGHWGLGPSITEDGTRFGHGGANEGFRCEMTALLAGDQGAVVMTNSDNGGRLVGEILIAIANEYGWSGPKPMHKVVVQLPDEDWKALAGVYRGAMGDFVARAQDGRLIGTVSAAPGVKWEFAPESRSSFFATEGGMPLAVTWKEDGTVAKVSLGSYDFERVE